MTDTRSKTFDRVLVLLLILVILVTRFANLATFVTVDDGTRSLQAANFYDALAQREFENTFQIYIPGVTTMWAGTLAFLVYFPEYRGLGLGQLDKELALNAIIREHGKDPLTLMRTTWIVHSVATAATMILILMVLLRLLPTAAAIVLAGLMSFDPFYLGHSRIAAHEGLMSGFIVLSILSLILYQKEPTKPAFLALSAIAAGLAALTKSTALFVFPVIGLLLLEQFWRTKSEATLKTQLWRNLLTPGMMWFGIFALTYVAVWPAMWVEPIGILQKVFANLASYALHGQNLDARDLAGEADNLAYFTPGFSTFIKSLIWRSTPLTWLGSLMAVAGFFRARRELQDKTTLRMLVFLSLQAAIFIAVLGLVRGRNSAHYILTAHLCLDLIAGIGYVWMAGWLKPRFPLLSRSVVMGAAALLAAFQLAIALPQYPYFFTYFNNFIVWADGPQTFGAGYGEGLELAAEYLAAKPNAEDDTVLAWYGLAFSYFYPGETEILYPSETWDTSLIERLRRSDYLVIYYTHQMQRNMPAKLLDDLTIVPVEHTIWLNGVEYIRIYDVNDLPPEVYVPDDSTP